MQLGLFANSGGAGTGGDENCAIDGLKAAFGDHVTLPVYPPATGGAARNGTNESTRKRLAAPGIPAP